jgi:hypothetical protein
VPTSPATLAQNLNFSTLTLPFFHAYSKFKTQKLKRLTNRPDRRGTASECFSFSLILFKPLLLLSFSFVLFVLFPCVLCLWVLLVDGCVGFVSCLWLQWCWWFVVTDGCWLLICSWDYWLLKAEKEF